MLFRRTVFCVFGFLLMILISGAAFGETSSLSKAPDFTLPYIKGKGNITLSKVLPQAELTVLLFFNSECEECMEAIATLSDLPAEIDKQKISAQVIGVNFDVESLGRIRSFIRGEEISFPVLSDAFEKTAYQYECAEYSFSYYIVDKSGKIRDSHLDKRPQIRAYLIDRLKQISSSKQ